MDRRDFNVTFEYPDWIGGIHKLTDWIGSAKMDPCPTLKKKLDSPIAPLPSHAFLGKISSSLLRGQGMSRPADPR